MYFPYLRGSQYELLAIREGIQKGIIFEKIIPIIEPIKLSSTLLSTMKTAIKFEKEISIICNPNIKNFFKDLKDPEKIKERETFYELLNNKYIIKMFNLKEFWEDSLEEYKSKLDIEENNIILVCEDTKFIKDIKNGYKNIIPRSVLIPEKDIFLEKIKYNKISLEDKFSRKSRNADYLEDEDNFFSEYPNYYENKGYFGFSDYVTIGKEFKNKGFSPYAVAIHITYLNEEDDTIRVHHFVSDSNEDTKDTPKKYYEAVKKLYEFEFSESSRTKSLEEFFYHYENQSYPALGTVKKLSLLHHFELVKNILDKN